MIINLDYKSEIPLYLQLRNEIVRGIGTGELQFGEELPTVRSLASDMGVNAMTVNKAYALLKAQGYITADRRKGTSVSMRQDLNGSYHTEEISRQLQLLTCEAAIRGYPKEAFLLLCNQIYPLLAD